MRASAVTTTSASRTTMKYAVEVRPRTQPSRDLLLVPFMLLPSLAAGGIAGFAGRRRDCRLRGPPAGLPVRSGDEWGGGGRTRPMICPSNWLPFVYGSANTQAKER